VMIQDIKEPLSQNNRKLREENQWENFFPKHEVSSNSDHSVHASPLKDVFDPLKSDTI
jgi:hypothetical protein